MAKRHYIPVTADVPGAASEGNCALIRKVIRTALAAEGVDVPCEVDVLLTNDSGIHEINREMRQVDASTDVLSFPEFDLRPGELPAPEDADPGTGLVPLGDMVISMEHVAAQAREYGHTRRRELSYLVVHSALHLLGYDHLDEGPQKAQMRAREEAILAQLGITRFRNAFSPGRYGDPTGPPIPAVPIRTTPAPRRPAGHILSRGDGDGMVP